MRTYFFSVIFGNHYYGYHIRAKTLSQAKRLLESEIMNHSYLHEFGSYVVCKTYTIYSASGKRSHRTFSKVIRGVA